MEPERPVRHTWYRCDKAFALDEWDALSTPPASERVYGVAMVHGRETQLWRVSGLQTTLVQTLQTTTQKHQRKGGSSAARIQRLRMNKLAHNVSFVGEALHAAFWDGDRNRPTVEALIVAGAAQMHELVTDELCDGLRAVVVGPIAWPDSNVRRLFESVRADLDRFHLARDRATLAPMHQLLATEPELLEFGLHAVIERLPLFERVFVSERTHADTLARLIADNAGQLPANVVPILVADDLDAYEGVVAIKHMPTTIDDRDD